MPIENNQDLHDLTRAMHEFVRKKGWYDVTSKRVQSPRNLAISLSIEAAEVLELFQWGEQPHDQQQLASELADVMLYLLQLASVTEVDLGEAVEKKLAINAKRTWDNDV